MPQPPRRLFVSFTRVDCVTLARSPSPGCIFTRSVDQALRQLPLRDCAGDRSILHLQGTCVNGACTRELRTYGTTEKKFVPKCPMTRCNNAGPVALRPAYFSKGPDDPLSTTTTSLYCSFTPIMSVAREMHGARPRGHWKRRERPHYTSRGPGFARTANVHAVSDANMAGIFTHARVQAPHDRSAHKRAFPGMVRRAAGDDSSLWMPSPSRCLFSHVSKGKGGAGAGAGTVAADEAVQPCDCHWLPRGVLGWLAVDLPA